MSSMSTHKPGMRTCDSTHSQLTRLAQFDRSVSVTLATEYDTLGKEGLRSYGKSQHAGEGST